MPSGMELFPAANDDQWTLIKRVIDDCDYYIVIIAGRYGSVSDDGISYTEMEYRYALEKNKPIIGFLHKNPAQIPSVKTDIDKEKNEKLEIFRDLVRKKMIKFWESPAELGSVVSRSLIRLIKDNPTHGWVKGDNLSSDAAREEILRLKSKIEKLESEIEVISTIDPDIQKNLARGSDKVEVEGIVLISDHGGSYNASRYTHKTELTWNDVFSAVSPLLLDEGSKRDIERRIVEVVTKKDIELFRKFAKSKSKTFAEFEINDNSVEMCVVQFIALNYIEKGIKRRPINDRGSYWKLTPIGEKAMYELRAIRRPSDPALFDTLV